MDNLILKIITPMIQSYLSTSWLNDSDSSEPPSLTSSMKNLLNCIIDDDDLFRAELEKSQNEEGRSTVLSKNNIHKENMEQSPTIKEVIWWGGYFPFPQVYRRGRILGLGTKVILALCKSIQNKMSSYFCIIIKYKYLMMKAYFRNM